MHRSLLTLGLATLFCSSPLSAQPVVECPGVPELCARRESLYREYNYNMREAGRLWDHDQSAARLSLNKAQNLQLELNRIDGELDRLRREQGMTLRNPDESDE